MEQYGLTKRYLITALVLILAVAPTLGYCIYRVQRTLSPKQNTNLNSPTLTPPDRSSAELKRVMEKRLNEANINSGDLIISSVKKTNSWWITVKTTSSNKSQTTVLIGDFYTSPDSMVVIAYPLRPMADYSLAQQGVPLKLIDTMRIK